RGGGAGETFSARSSRSSVVSPMAETTTTTSLPSLCVRTIRSATFLMRSASCTEEPPYFCTTRATADLLSWPRESPCAASRADHHWCVREPHRVLVGTPPYRPPLAAQIGMNFATGRRRATRPTGANPPGGTAQPGGA